MKSPGKVLLTLIAFVCCSLNCTTKRAVGEDVNSFQSSKRKKSDFLNHADDSKVNSEDESSIVNEDQQKGKLKNFLISKASRRILKSRGITHLFPIQYLTYNHVYEGKDVIAQAREYTTYCEVIVVILMHID